MVKIGGWLAVGGWHSVVGVMANHRQHQTPSQAPVLVAWWKPY